VHLSKVYCSRHINWQQIPLQQEEALIAGTKQGRQTDKAGEPTRQVDRQGRQAGWSIDVATLTDNIFVAVTNKTYKTKLCRVAEPLSSLPE
jgi:hypothetical protein